MAEQFKISSPTLFHTKQFFLMTEIDSGSVTKLKSKLIRKIAHTNPIFKTVKTNSDFKFFRLLKICQDLQLKFPENVPAGIYLFKVNNRNTRTRCELCSKLTIKISERHHWRRSVVFVVNFEHISHLFLVLQLLTLNI